MAKAKTHYAQCDPATESDPYDYWTEPVCGIGEVESPLTDNLKFVTCKRCLKKLEDYPNP